MSAPATAPLLLVACLLGGCAMGPAAPVPAHYARQVSIGVEVAAALAAAAMRGELPFADPVPQAAGAPATRLDPVTYVVRYELDGTGEWLPAAHHRLSIAMPRRLAEEPLRVVVTPADGLPGHGRRAVAVAELRLVGDRGHCRVEGTLPGAAASDLAAALDRAWRLTDAAAALPSLRETNLRAFAAHQLVAAARRADDRHHRRAALLQAQALGAEAPALQFALGVDAAQHGDRHGGATLLWSASLATADPTLRQRAAWLADAIAGETANAAGLRGLARASLARDELAEAATLLHTASRDEPSPNADYRLRHELHRRAGDSLAALACSLLQREQDASAPLAASTDEDLERAGLGSLVRRLATARRRALEPTAAPPFTPMVAAAPR